MHPQTLGSMTTIHQQDLRQQAEHLRRANEARRNAPRRATHNLSQWLQVILAALR